MIRLLKTLLNSEPGRFGIAGVGAIALGYVLSRVGASVLCANLITAAYSIVAIYLVFFGGTEEVDSEAETESGPADRFFVQSELQNKLRSVSPAISFITYWGRDTDYDDDPRFPVWTWTCEVAAKAVIRGQVATAVACMEGIKERAWQTPDFNAIRPWNEPESKLLIALIEELKGELTESDEYSNMLRKQLELAVEFCFCQENEN